MSLIDEAKTAAQTFWAWQNAHRHVSLVLLGFIIGYGFRWWLAK